MMIGCSSDDNTNQTELINCTEVFVFGLNIQVKDLDSRKHHYKRDYCNYYRRRLYGRISL